MPRGILVIGWSLQLCRDFVVAGRLILLGCFFEANEMPAAASSAASSCSTTAAALTISAFFLAMELMRVACGTTVGSVARATSLVGNFSASGGEGEELKSCLVADDGV